MESINGEKVSLNDVMMENGLLVNFTCNTCPWVKRWQDRYNGLAEASKKNKIGFIAINPNAGKRDRGESMDDMKKFSDKYIKRCSRKSIFSSIGQIVEVCNAINLNLTG